MGTSGSYGGSGGRAWGQARGQAGDYAENPTDANAEKLVNDIAKALDWDGAGEGPPRRGVPAQPRLRTGGGEESDGPGGAGGGLTGGGGRSRSRAQAARIGGGVAAAGLALRAGDAETLATFGLSLTELGALTPHEQARTILDAVGGSLGGLQEDELNRASAAALLAILEDDTFTGADAVRVFVVEYVWEVALTEIGDGLRDGTRNGFASVDEEDKLHDLIEARVAQVDLPDDVGPEIEAVIFEALDDARTFLKASK